MFRNGLLLLMGALLMMAGCSENVPPTKPGGPEGPPAEYDGPQTSLAFQLSQVDSSDQIELVSDMFIMEGGITGWFTATINPPFGLSTYAGHWYNHCLTNNGVPFLGSGYTFVGQTPHQLWTDENKGIFASTMVLSDEQGEPWIWQWPSNVDQLVDLEIEVLNWSSATDLGIVGTLMSYVWHPAELEYHNGQYQTTLRALPGDIKLAVVNMDSRYGLGDSVTVRINGVELVHFVEDFVHPNHLNVDRYFRFSVGPSGVITPLGEENRWTYGKTVSVTTPHVDEADQVYLKGPGLTSGQSVRMTYKGSQTWEVTGLASWVGLHELEVVTEHGQRLYRTVRLNGIELHHLVTIPLDPDPPILVFQFTLRPNTVEQEMDNRTVDVDIDR